jgi:DnaA-homolog protein
VTEARPTQLTLGIRLNDECCFDNYLVSAANSALLETLLKPAHNQKWLFVRAEKGAGLTHLLQALCQAEQEAEHPALYLPLAEPRQFGPDILQGVQSMSLLCIDNLDAVCGDDAWERALFIALNDIVAGHTRLVLGANSVPQYLPIKMPDLRSRLQAAPVYQLREPTDEEKLELLRLRAGRRGMRLSEEVASYIFTRSERSLSALMQVLEALDASSLTHRRALTIPLVRETLGWSRPEQAPDRSE